MALGTQTRAVALSFTTCFIAVPAAAFDLAFVAASPPIYAKPHDLVLSPDGRHLYVADNGNDRIAVLDPEDLALLGVLGEGEVSAPHDVAFDAQDRLLVADTGNSRIAIYQVNGGEGRLAGELRGAIRRPEGVAVHPNGRVYATGASSDNVEAFEDGRSLGELGGFSAPHDVAVAPDGELWVADASNDRLVVVSPDLAVLGTVEGADYGFDGPRYLDFDAAGRLYVADKYAHQIKVLAPDASLIFTLGSGRGELGPGEFDRPEGVAIRGADIWFSDTYNDRIVRYRIVE
jgi:DNA-binding beta-propeller fold protein YncE